MENETLRSGIYKFWNSPTFKLLAILFLVVLLLIPQSLLTDLIHEREFYKAEATQQVTEKWASAQSIIGPMLKVPVRKQEIVNKEVLQSRKDYYVLPSDFEATADLQTEMRKKGFYKVPVYTAACQLEGQFLSTEIQKLEKSDETILWEEIEIVIGIQDLKGIDGLPQFQINGKPLELSPGNANHATGTQLMRLDFPMSTYGTSGKIAFKLIASIKGTERFSIVPAGKSSTLRIAGNWPHPGFEGAFLPQSSQVDSDGFRATYQVSHFNRAFSGTMVDPFSPSVLNESMSVQMVIPADEYQLGMRAVKYCALVIVLIFMSLFLYETISKERVHIIQFLLIGAAIIIFYSLLIALSEIIGFTYAYITASIASVALIHFYMYNIIKRRKVNWLLSMIQCIILGFIAIVIHAQEMALLMGSIALFITLAIVMYTSRKIDWSISG